MNKSKSLIIIFIQHVILLFAYDQVYAIDCSDCHTMHNSQDGASIFGSPNNNLLSSGCVGCHTSAGGKVSTNNAPAILHTNDPAGQGGGKTLASGDFFWVNSDEIANSSKGHNVIDLAGVTDKDTKMPDFNPPGWDPIATSANFAFGQVAGGETSWSSQLTCAGKYGCHGTHNETGSFNGIRGAHHTNTNGSATRAEIADTIGNSYRFLGAIKGLEDPDWNWSETAVKHNEYFGAQNTAVRNAGTLDAYGNRDTMSFLCAQCHGLFHSTVNTSSNSSPIWGRHPTDVLLPASGEYALYNTQNGSTIGEYSTEAPVARSTVPPSSNSTVNAGTDIIMCLSCHRAHGSDQDKILMWDPSDMLVNSTNSGGCFTCHTDKNEPGTNP